MRDPIREKQVADTPEERVRQAVIRMLMESMGIPAALIAVERSVLINGSIRRPDIIIHSRTGEPWMVVECKAPKVQINQGTFDQVSNYNRVLQAPFLFVTNGEDHLCARVDGSSITFLENLPRWDK